MIRLRAMILSSRMAGRGLLALPLEGALLDLVEQAEDEHADEEQDRAQDGDVVGEELAVDEGPRDEDHDLQVEEHEEERREVELHREAGVDHALARDAALVGGVLDLGVPSRAGRAGGWRR